MQPNHHPVTRTRSLDSRRNNNNSNNRSRKVSGQKNSNTNPYVQVSGPATRDRDQLYGNHGNHPPHPFSRGPQRTVHQSRDNAPFREVTSREVTSREVTSRTMSPPQSYNNRGYPQSPLARTTGGVFTFESRDHDPPPRPREGLNLWSGTRSEPTTPKLLSPEGTSNPTSTMVPQRDSPFLHQRSLLGHFNDRRNNPHNLRNISENLRSVTSLPSTPHPLSRNRGVQNTNRSSSRLNPMAASYQPDHPYRANLTHTNSLPSSVPNSPMTSSNLSLAHVTSRPRSVSPQPHQLHSALRRNTLDTVGQGFERVRSASPNPLPFDTFEDGSHADPVLNQPPRNLNLMRHVDSSISELCTNEPYLNVCSYDSRHQTSTSSSRVTSPQPLDSPYPRDQLSNPRDQLSNTRDQLSNPRDQLSNPRDRVQKNSFESGYSSSSGSSNSCNSRRGGYGIVRRRTIGGGERERDRCSTPVASPPQGDGGLDQFVKTRERAESVGRSGEGQNGDVRKWGSCSRLEYNGQPGYGHYPVPGHERTEGDGGPASYPEPYNNQYTEPAYNPYNRRHSSSKMSSHSNNSDEVILAQKAELEEKNRVIESLKMRMTDGDSKLTERAYSDKSGEHGAVAESLDSGIDIRSETGVMKPLFGGQRTSSDERNELAKLRLYVKQLEAKVDSGVSSSYEEESKVENLLKDNQKLIDEKTSISRKFARLQDYLTTLPTVNEYTKLQEQLTQLAEENTNLQEEQKRVTESSKDVKLKDADMKKYQKKCTDMRESIMKLEKQNNLLKSQNANQAKQELQKVELEKSKMEKKMEQLKKEISVLSEQKESTKSLVGGYYEKFNNEQEKTKILTQSLENSVNEVEDLRSELDRRIHQEEELQGRISDLERELEAVLLKMEEYESQENRDVENSELLMAEYNAAFQDLNSVVEVCQMRVQGQQLDISLLLGLGASPRPSNKEDLTVESQLRNIQALRSNIENIRTLLSDLYAEDIGSQCPTQ